MSHVQKEKGGTTQNRYNKVFFYFLVVRLSKYLHIITMYFNIYKWKKSENTIPIIVKLFTSAKDKILYQTEL